MFKSFYIQTFGCQQNVADSKRIATWLQNQELVPADHWKKADVVVINSCMVRQMAEDRIYGLIRNIRLQSSKKPKIIIAGCLAGVVSRDKSGKFLKKIKHKLPSEVEFLLNENVPEFFGEIEIGSKDEGLLVISNGCNNFCTYCVVPFARGREVSRPYDKILKEAKQLKQKGCQKIMLLGQNVNSYGSDLIKNQKKFVLPDGRELKPVLVKHLGKLRIPTLFPWLLEDVAKLGFAEIRFLSSNPWDFSDELIEVIARNSNICREIHLPVQSGSGRILKKMNRWYTPQEYLVLVQKLKAKIPEVKITTDIIVGFPGETDEDFAETLAFCRKVKFKKAFIARYSPRPLTAASVSFPDSISPKVKKQRWEELEKVVNGKIA